MAARALLFDLDGTIWDSFPWYAQILYEARGLDPQETTERLLQGISIVSIASVAGLSRTRFRTLCAQEAAKLKLYPTVRESLHTLAAMGVPMGVVTNLPEWLVGPILDRFGFSELFSVREFRASKPSPTALTRAAEGVSPGEVNSVYYVGDQEQDARAAADAGLAFAWASYGYGRARPKGTAAVLRTFRDVLAL
jgi:phosphoglycolate phosphatase